MIIRTINGYDFFEVSSAMQKAIRRADAELPDSSPWNSGTATIGTMYGNACLPSVPRTATDSSRKR